MQIFRRLRFGALAFALLLFAGAAQAASWTGTWDTRWRGGGAMIDLRQDGNRVTGTYPLYNGRIEAEVQGRELRGRWIEGDRFGSFLFVLAEDGATFMGRFDTGEWWTGGRVREAAPRMPVDQATPRRAMRTFLTAFNRARLGDEEAWGSAAAVVDFGEEGARLRPGQRLSSVQGLAEAVDLATFRLWSIPGRSAEGDVVQVRLARAGTEATLALTFQRREGLWFIVMPSADDLAAQVRRMRAARPAPGADDAHLALRSPRDVLLTLFDRDANEAQRLAAFNLDEVPEAVRTHEGRLAVGYLRRILSRIGPVLPQEVPDDPASPRAYVHFDHPLGRIAIARRPDSTADAPRWAVTADSVAALRPLYAALEAMPPDPEAVSGLAEDTGYFAVRRWVRGISPTLLAPLGPIEAWQVLGILGLVAAGWLLGFLVGRPATILFAWLAGVPRGEARAIRWPARLAAASGLWLAGSNWLGLPDLVQGSLLALFSITLAVAMAWAGWLVVDAVARRLMALAARTDTQVDEIMLSLVAGAMKVGLAAGAAVYVALTLSIPVAGIIAGLGVGGLAFAFASRETLQNVFGAGILLTDRPFKRGDSIVAGEVRGTVEKVGIRSTRVRTADDSLVVVPNGRLADATINNMGTRRHRLVTGKVTVGWTARPDQVDALIEGIRALLDARDDIAKERTLVGATALGTEGVDVEFTAYLAVSGLPAERAAKHQIMREVLALAHRLKLPACEEARPRYVMAAD
ncbi:mechanosensitive ion channel family protein [Falsiroseomonas oryziterrae]|uniref:mechanosensitive ion channel family protein n=1 Tax=Falsiroseomonas oryziterrae TaxID=2911368 RepID=UPI001F239922|nr:mechanosensitive ion channel domain-containing protein [Roseomonas sp. NPKOSM-4]